MNMAQFVPVFPLNIVVFPTENLNLHIFEEKYQQLVNDCIAQHKNFAIIPVINGQIKEFGTFIDIIEVVQRYEDGKMDIRTRGIEVFRVLEITKEIPDKLYAGAIVAKLENQEINVSERLSDLIKNEVIRLFKLLNDQAIDVAKLTMNSSFDIAHKVGFTLEEEYQLLQLVNEIHRQEYIRRHLRKLEPTLNELEKLKEKIKMNGHFRHISGADF